ncbi:MAG: DNA methyltransferase [Candidatus Parvarchaeota archaeon]
MAQTKFEFPKVDDEEIDKTVSFLKELFLKVRQRFKSYSVYEHVIVNSGHYTSGDIVDQQKPEELVKQYIVKPLLEFLGYEVVSETIVNSPFGRRSPDYVAESSKIKERYFLVEVEPISVDLNSRGKGLDQVREWLLSIQAGTPYGIATDGLTWILTKYDLGLDGLREMIKVDLRAIVSSFLGSSLIDKESIRSEIEKLLSLKLKNFKSFVNNYLIEIEQQKEDITQRFYEEYVENVFGLDKGGNVKGGVSLLSSIVAPSEMKNPKRELFALITMNRLLFIAFLQDRGIVAPNLIENLHMSYKNSQLASSFYSSYIKPLFYEVLNKEKSMRSSSVRENEIYKEIPYLNGGLFRQNIENEDRYDIRNEGFELVLDKLIGRYKIGLSAESDLKPEVLGYIFEKTINYISGQGTQKQKAEGAYYTPDDVVNFIVDKTLMNEIYESMIKGLKNAGWQDKDLMSYDSVENILKNVPKNPNHIQSMISSLYNIKVLDPACGSGHFLVAATNAITRVIASLYMEMDEKFSQYEIKRQVISKNIFGVDIDEIGVEITKLRLWLSVISDIRDEEEIDPSSIKTLPNIDFNIIAGNSLVGQLF